jgi:hypothetical protein
MSLLMIYPAVLERCVETRGGDAHGTGRTAR